MRCPFKVIMLTVLGAQLIALPLCDEKIRK